MSDFDCAVLAYSREGAALAPIDAGPQALPARVEHVLLSFVCAGRLVALKGILSRDDHAGGLHFDVVDRAYCAR